MHNLLIYIIHHVHHSLFINLLTMFQKKRIVFKIQLSFYLKIFLDLVSIKK